MSRYLRFHVSPLKQNSFCHRTSQQVCGCHNSRTLKPGLFMWRIFCLPFVPAADSLVFNQSSIILHQQPHPASALPPLCCRREARPAPASAPKRTTPLAVLTPTPEHPVTPAAAPHPGRLRAAAAPLGLVPGCWSGWSRWWGV